MFNKKELQELKTELANKLEEIKNNQEEKSSQHQEQLELIKNELRINKDQNKINSEQLTQELTKIKHLQTEFETALNRINSTSRTIEDRAAASIKEVAEKEIDHIRATGKEFRNIEQELRTTLSQINTLQMEISKFISISQQIKLVDFTMKMHSQELKDTEVERRELLNENERLKMIMAKMKRNN